MKKPVPPFLLPPETMVRHSGWRLQSPDGSVSALPTELDHWDYQTTLRLLADLDFQQEEVCKASGLHEHSTLAVVVIARAPRTRVEKAVGRFDVLPRSASTSLHVQVSGEDLGGRLSLETVLVATNPRSLSPLAANQPGGILWRSSQNVHLEGVGAQFPTDTADFALRFPESVQAGWVLTIDTSDLDALFLSAVRLTLNTSQERILRLIAGKTDEATEVLCKVLEWDVARQLVAAAFTTEGVTEADYDPEATSVGGVLRNHLSRVWPSESMDTLSTWWNSDRARIERQIQSHCGLAG